MESDMTHSPEMPSTAEDEVRYDSTPSIVEAAVAQCPSGALHFVRHDAGTVSNRTEREP